MIKLLHRNDEPTVIVNKQQKPVTLACNAEWLSKVNLPQLIRRLSPEKVPAIKLA